MSGFGVATVKWSTVKPMMMNKLAVGGCLFILLIVAFYFMYGIYGSWSSTLQLILGLEADAGIPF